MQDFDTMPRAMRDLVNEYGFNVCMQIRDKCSNDVEKMREVLENWRLAIHQRPR